MEVPNTFSDLFLGYTVIWVIIALFVVRMTYTQGKLVREITALKEQLREKGDNRDSREQEASR